MIGILLITHDNLGESLVRCAVHVMGYNHDKVACLNIYAQDKLPIVATQAQDLVRQLDDGEGILILSDMYGATPCNIACQLVVPGKVECLAGVNLPMLVRALTYRTRPLPVVIEKALSGGLEGVMVIPMDFNAEQNSCNYQ